MTSPLPLRPDSPPPAPPGAVAAGPSDRLISGVVVLVILYATATAVWEAARKPFWFDEVFTVVLSEKPSFSELMTALRDAADTSGPGYYAMQRSLRWSADPHIAHRAASIVSVALSMLLLYAFTRRELGPLAGAVAVFFILATELNHGYEVEARAYGAMVFAISAALLAWQRADRWPWALALGASAVFAVSVHYYAIFALVPIGAAELTRLFTTRELRWRVWVALSGGALTLLALWPLLQAQRAYYGTNYFSRPSLGKVLETYDILSGLGVNGAGLALALTIAVVALVLLSRALRGDSTTLGLRPEVLVLIVGLVGLPFIIGVVTRVMHGGYTYRYAIAVLPGLAIGSACLSRVVSRRSGWGVLFVLMSGLAAHELVFWGSGGVASALRRPPPVTRHPGILARVNALNLPLVVDDPHDYVPLAYYTQHQNLKLVGVLEQQLALRRTGTDSVELDILVLAKHLPLNLQRFHAFCLANYRFLLLTRAGGADWKSDELLERGFVLTATYRERPFTLYTVSAPPDRDRNTACQLDVVP